jgi:hypothetical protein
MSDSAEDLRRRLDALAVKPPADPEARLAQVESLIARFEPDLLRCELANRLVCLDSASGGLILQLVEAVGDETLLRCLAASLEAQPDLEPGRMWEALELLQGSRALDDHPELRAALDDWTEMLEAEDDGEGAIAELARLLDDDDDPGVVAVVLAALQGVEPAHRPSLLGSLAREHPGPGLTQLLRLLVHARDPLTRNAALDALDSLDPNEPTVRTAWRRLVDEHPDAGVAARSGDALARSLDSAQAESRQLASADSGPLDALVTEVDGRGLATIVLRGHPRDGRYATAAFQCDMLSGVVQVAGQIDTTEAPGIAWFQTLLTRPDRDAIAGRPALALRLLAGALSIPSRPVPLDLPFWLESTLGRITLPAQRMALGAFDEFSRGPTAEVSQLAAARVLEACPGWLDDSDTAYNLAEELLLRQGPLDLDPKRDAGAIRILFESELSGCIERHRRMLLWMAAFWQDAGSHDLAVAAWTLGTNLDEAGQATPGQPYLQELAIRSLTRAQANLLAGIDLRDPAARQRLASTAWP